MGGAATNITPGRATNKIGQGGGRVAEGHAPGVSCRYFPAHHRMATSQHPLSVADGVRRLAPDPAAACASCAAALHGPYCHVCGEKRLDRHDYALGHFLEHTVDAFTHFDFKVPQALWSLLRHPGRMTADVLAGRRVKWAKPLQVFLIANLLYYALASALHLRTFQTTLEGFAHTPYRNFVHAWSAAQAARLSLTEAAYAAKFAALSHSLSKSLVIFFVPVLALVLALLQRRSRRYFLEHVTVAIHFVSLLLLLLPIPMPLMYALIKGGMLAGANGDGVYTLCLSVLLGFYAAVFFRPVYGVSKGLAFWQGLAVVGVFLGALVFLYRPLLFFIVHALL